MATAPIARPVPTVGFENGTGTTSIFRLGLAGSSSGVDGGVGDGSCATAVDTSTVSLTGSSCASAGSGSASELARRTIRSDMGLSGDRRQGRGLGVRTYREK